MFEHDDIELFNEKVRRGSRADVFTSHDTVQHTTLTLMPSLVSDGASRPC